MPKGDIFGFGDLDLWPTTLTFELDLDIFGHEWHATIQVCIHFCLARIVRRTDGHTHRHTHRQTMPKLLHPPLTLGVMKCRRLLMVLLFDNSVIEKSVKHWNTNPLTVGKRNYFKGYGILLHKLPVVVVLFTQSNNNVYLKMLQTVVHVLELQNLDVVKYGINLMK